MPMKTLYTTQNVYLLKDTRHFKVVKLVYLLQLWQGV